MPFSRPMVPCARFLLLTILLLPVVAATWPAVVPAADRRVVVGVYENAPKVFTDLRRTASGGT